MTLVHITLTQPHKTQTWNTLEHMASSPANTTEEGREEKKKTTPSTNEETKTAEEYTKQNGVILVLPGHACLYHVTVTANRCPHTTPPAPQD